MATVPAGFAVAWPDASAIPTGWERVTELDGYHPKGAAAGADPGTAGGSDTHTHTSPGHTHTVGSHTHTGGTSGNSDGTRIGNADGGGTTTADRVHNHTISTSGAQTATLSSTVATFDTSTNDPPYYTVRWIRSLGTPSGIPDGAWAYWDDATLPASWSSPAAVRLKYLKGAIAGANGGDTGGSSSGHTHSGAAHTHTLSSHTHSGGASGAPNSSFGATAGAGAALSTNAHTHTATFAASSGDTSGSTASGATASTTAEVPYVKLGIIQNDNGTTDLPVGVIGLWLGLLSAIPLSLAICDGTGGTQDTRGKYIKGADISAGSFTGIGDTGGSLTHDHTDPSTHTHTADHTHATSLSATAATAAFGTGTTQGIGSPHSHSAGSSGSDGGTSGATAQTVDAANNEPANKTVVFVKYTGSIDVTITSPTADQEMTAPAITVTWTLSAGTQTSYQVKIYESNQTTLLHDSGSVVSATQSYDVPSTAGLRTGRTYYIQVEAVNNSSVPGASDLRRITTAWTPPATLGALTLTPLGGT